MQLDALKLVGWAGQACFFSRFLVQWIASERVRRSIVPEVFWWISLVGTLLSGVYAWLGESHDAIFVAGYAFNVVIYARNLVLMHRPGARLEIVPMTLIALGFAAAVGLGLTNDPKVRDMLQHESPLWLTIGLVGQVLWVGRFLVQWILAERRGRADLPPVFFLMSLVGCFLLLAYLLQKPTIDWVLVAGQVPGPIVYGRNLLLQWRSAREVVT